MALFLAVIVSMFIRQNPNALSIFIACFSLSVIACSENGIYPEPVYETKQVHRPFTFGPGSHREVVVYNNVKGWVGGQEPDWIACKSLGSHYKKMLDKHIDFENEGVQIYFFFGKTWISRFIKFYDQKTTVIKITEWDDHSNYDVDDLQNMMNFMCRN